MKPSVMTNAGLVKPGTHIRIVSLDDPYDSTYPGKTGFVEHIDDMGQMHGTWGGLAIIPEEDTIEIIL